MPTTYDEHLLPLNATQLEKVLSAAGKRVQKIPVPIDLLKRPQEVPVAFLPHLAYEFSVDIWDETWPEALKRSVTDASIGLHERKGTAYVLKKYIEYSGGEVVSITKPPQRVFSGPSITPEAREAWLSELPQVRTWLIQEEGSASPRKLFSGTRARALSSVPAPLFRESKFAIPSDALSRMHRRARWVMGGVETETTLGISVGMFRAFIRLAIGLAREPEFHQLFAHGISTNRMPHLRQSRRQLFHAFRYPDQRPHGVAQRRGFNQALERGDQPRIVFTNRPTPAPAAANLPLRQRCRIEIILAAIDRRTRKPGDLRHRRQAAPTGAPHLARRKQSPSSFVELRANRLPSLPNCLLIDHATDLHPLTQNRNPPSPSHSAA